LHRRLDIRCYVPHLLPPSCEFSSASNCGPDLLLPRHTHALSPFNYAQQTHQGAPAWYLDGEHTGYSPFGGIPCPATDKSPGIAKCMLLAARSGQWLLWVFDHSQHLCGRGQRFRSPQGSEIRHGKLASRPGDDAFDFWVIDMDWSGQRTNDMQFPVEYRSIEVIFCLKKIAQSCIV